MPRKQVSKRKSPKTQELQLIQMAIDLGALNAKIIAPETVETSEWVRWKCQFGCGGFGTSLMCPPHSPRPERTRVMLDHYNKGILFESLHGKTKKIAAELERKLFLNGYYKAFGLGAGPCSLCKQCAFEKGCKHPAEARPAMEACGIDVFATVRKHGFTLEVARTHEEPQHYFGLVLIE